MLPFSLRFCLIPEKTQWAENIPSGVTAAFLTLKSVPFPFSFHIILGAEQPIHQVNNFCYYIRREWLESPLWTPSCGRFLSPRPPLVCCICVAIQIPVSSKYSSNFYLFPYCFVNWKIEEKGKIFCVVALVYGCRDPELSQVLVLITDDVKNQRPNILTLFGKCILSQFLRTACFVE